MRILFALVGLSGGLLILAAFRAELLDPPSSLTASDGLLAGPMLVSACIVALALYRKDRP